MSAHDCTPPTTATPGSAWKCGDCGTYWRFEVLDSTVRALLHGWRRVEVKR